MSRKTRPTNRIVLPGRLMLAPLLLTALALPSPEARGDSITQFDSFGVQQYNQTANNTVPTGPRA
jgi:hypothetical protein